MGNFPTLPQILRSQLEENRWVALTPDPGRIKQMDPPQGPIIYTIGILGSRIGGFHLLDPPRALGRVAHVGKLLNGKATHPEE